MVGSVVEENLLARLAASDAINEGVFVRLHVFLTEKLLQIVLDVENLLRSSVSTVRAKRHLTSGLLCSFFTHSNVKRNRANTSVKAPVPNPCI